MALGSVSIATFTRAEIDTMLKKAVYSNGKVVWSTSVGASSSTTVPDEVDYIVCTASDKEVKIARGGDAKVVGGYNSASGTLTYTFTFSVDGKFTTKYGYSGSSSATMSGNYNLVGYQYY